MAVRRSRKLSARVARSFSRIRRADFCEAWLPSPARSDLTLSRDELARGPAERRPRDASSAAELERLIPGLRPRWIGRCSSRAAPTSTSRPARRLPAAVSARVAARSEPARGSVRRGERRMRWTIDAGGRLEARLRDSRQRGGRLGGQCRASAAALLGSASRRSAGRWSSCASAHRASRTCRWSMTPRAASISRARATIDLAQSARRDRDRAVRRRARGNRHRDRDRPLRGVVDWPIERVERSWAGLRSFAPDRFPVYGFDPDVPGFFWCAGQGGFGIQTSPAAASLRRRCCLAKSPTRCVAHIDPAIFSPRDLR